ncbi:hypothetical protein [Thiohalomonas denitrificans]|uniref:Universal stress protein family protein n=1 Tax=Thiohalomonas denitrificans TaxID=415747 RepID=A0A1G5PYM4_9GAMM|nr:hypothetical protein [Thiohalomonas denitrificans]SCZ54684.1 hypothetical protein SAMN03097708_01010 [Thiohalomonas denitrificans]
MNHPDQDRHERRRILLALDYARDQVTLKAAALLAKSMRASLDAIFVEDEELRRVAQLPFACEIGFGSAVVRRMELPRLERDQRNRATELQRLLRRQAAASRVQWSFSVTRGSLPAAALAALPEADLYILPRRNGYLEQQRHIPGVITTLLDGSPQSLHALEAAAALSDHVPLRILVPMSKKGNALRARAMPLLHRLQHAALFIPIEDLSPETIAANVRAIGASLLVLGHAGQFCDEGVLKALQSATGTPLILAN